MEYKTDIQFSIQLENVKNAMENFEIYKCFFITDIHSIYYIMKGKKELFKFNFAVIKYSFQ